MDKNKKILINKTAVKFQVRNALVEDAVDHAFKMIKNLTASEELPKILIHNFGTFKPSLVRINKTIYYKIKKYREGTETRESVCEFIQKYWPARQRLIKEKLWSKKPGKKLK